ncbi:MAG: MlaD family protein [bacterium]
MKNEKVNYFAVGLLVFVALGLLFVTLYRITGNTGVSERYFSVYENVFGLNYGTPVFYQGFRVGQVETVKPLQDQSGKTRFRVEFSIESSWPIYADSVARVTSAGLLADVYVEIIAGGKQQRVEPGSEIASAIEADLFAAFTEMAQKASVLMDKSIEPLIAVLDKRLNTITADLADKLPKILDEADRTMINLRESSENIEQMLSKQNQQKVTSILNNADQSSEQALVLLKELNSSADTLKLTLDRLNQLVNNNSQAVDNVVGNMEYSSEILADQLNDILRNLEASSRHLNQFAKEISKEPNRLIFSPDATKEKSK